MSQINVAVVGGGGQVGSFLVGRLSQDHDLRVWAVCRNEITAAPLRLRALEARCGDVTDADQRSTLIDNADVVVNCALAAGLPRSARGEDEAMVDALADGGRRHLIHLSSVGVYGTCLHEHQSFDRPHPDDGYGRRKLHLERYLTRRAERISSLRYTIVRLGHVYGAGQWLSEAILALAADPAFRLPFSGALASNAVHVANVAAGIRTLCTGSSCPGVYNGFDPTNRPWRDVFDWNTDAAEMNPVPGLAYPESQAAAMRLRKRAQSSAAQRVAQETGVWLWSLPAGLVKAVPSLRDLGRQALGLVGSENLERRLRLRYYTMMAAGSPDASPGLEPWLLSSRAPGPTLGQPDAVDADEAIALGRWWKRLSNPFALTAWSTPEITQ